MKVCVSAMQLILIIVLVQVLCLTHVDAASTPESTPNMSLQVIMHQTYSQSILVSIASPSLSRYYLAKLCQTLPASDSNLKSVFFAAPAEARSFSRVTISGVAFIAAETAPAKIMSPWYGDRGSRAPPLGYRKGMSSAIANC